METFGAWMVPAVAMIGYFIVGVEIIAEQIEDPFGRDEDDLRLDDICQTIERNVLEITGPARRAAARRNAAPALSASATAALPPRCMPFLSSISSQRRGGS